MCGRFNVSSTPGLQELLLTLGSDVVLPPPRYNIAPTEMIGLLRRNETGNTEYVEARWWLTPRWAKSVSQKYAMFNARCEGLEKSRAFHRPFISQRGVVAMSSFIEWRGARGSKQPWMISNDSEALAVAALWEVWHGGEAPLLSCTLVTTAAAEVFKPWHDRMPVLLTPGECEVWMDNSRAIAGDDPMFRAKLKEPLVLTPINSAVGRSSNKDECVLEPVGEVVRLAP